MFSCLRVVAWEDFEHGLFSFLFVLLSFFQDKSVLCVCFMGSSLVFLTLKVVCLVVPLFKA